MEVRLTAMMDNGPIADISIDGLDDTADRQFKVGRIVNKASAINGAVQSIEIFFYSCTAEWLVYSRFFPHLCPVIGKVIYIPAAVWVKIHFPVRRLPLYGKKHFETGRPPKFMAPTQKPSFFVAIKCQLTVLRADILSVLSRVVCADTR